MSDGSGVHCPRFYHEFDYPELPWDDNDSVDFCPSCEGTIHLVADVTIKHKIAKTKDEIDFVEAIIRRHPMTKLIEAADELEDMHKQVCYENGEHPDEVDTPYLIGAGCIRSAYHTARESAGEVEVKPLVWVKHYTHEETGRYEAKPEHIGEAYHVNNEGWWFALDVLNKCDGIEDAKAAAQADYERRIRSALEE